MTAQIPGSSSKKLINLILAKCSKHINILNNSFSSLKVKNWRKKNIKFYLKLRDKVNQNFYNYNLIIITKKAKINNWNKRKGIFIALK